MSLEERAKYFRGLYEEQMAKRKVEEEENGEAEEEITTKKIAPKKKAKAAPKRVREDVSDGDEEEEVIRKPKKQKSVKTKSSDLDESGNGTANGKKKRKLSDWNLFVQKHGGEYSLKKLSEMYNKKKKQKK